MHEERGSSSSCVCLISGYKYDLPIFCINEPIEFPEVSKQDKLLLQNFEDKEIEVSGGKEPIIKQFLD